MSQVTTRQTYDKGGFTLHMLRGLMGDEAFWRGIREYYARHRDGNATTDDFRRAMEEASGRELGWFFDQWLRRGGLPALEGSWRYDAAAHSLEVEVRQVQPGEPSAFPSTWPSSARARSSRRARALELTQKTQTFRLPLEREPRDVRLDPQQWLLTDAVRFAKR